MSILDTPIKDFFRRADRALIAVEVLLLVAIAVTFAWNSPGTVEWQAADPWCHDLPPDEVQGMRITYTFLGIGYYAIGCRL